MTRAATRRALALCLAAAAVGAAVAAAGCVPSASQQRARSVEEASKSRVVKSRTTHDSRSLADAHEVRTTVVVTEGTLADARRPLALLATAHDRSPKAVVVLEVHEQAGQSGRHTISDEPYMRGRVATYRWDPATGALSIETRLADPDPAQLADWGDASRMTELLPTPAKPVFRGEMMPLQLERWLAGTASIPASLTPAPELFQ